MEHSWYILPLQDLWECNVDGESNTDREKGHPATLRDLVQNNRAIPAMQIALVTDVANALRQKYF